MNQYYLSWWAGALYHTIHELNLLSSRMSCSNLNWPLLPWLWWLDKSMAHSQHLQIQLRHGFLNITHQLMEGGFLPHAEETQGSRQKGGFWLDWSCGCGKSIDAVEAKDEARIIICGWKGCETLWVSVFGIIQSVCSPLIMQYHLLCVGLDHGINDWICDPCKSMERSRGRGGKQRCAV